MANEVTLTASLSFAKGRVAAVSMVKSGLQVTVAGSNYARGTESVGTSAQVLTLGSVSTPGYVFIQNLDLTNFVTVLDGVSGNACIKIKPGEVALFRCDTATPAVKADTATCIIEYLLVEA